MEKEIYGRFHVIKNIRHQIAFQYGNLVAVSCVTVVSEGSMWCKDYFIGVEKGLGRLISNYYRNFLMYSDLKMCKVRLDR